MFLETHSTTYIVDKKMNAARIALKRSPATLLRTAVFHKAANLMMVSFERRFSPVPAAAANEQVETCIKTENVDFVREAIRRMMTSKEENDNAKPISDEELEKNLTAFAVSEHQ